MNVCHFEEYLMTIILFFIPCIMLAGISALPTKPIYVGHKKQLFIDERFIETQKGISLTMNPPVKQSVRNVKKLLALPENAKLDFGKIFYDPSASPQKRWKKILRKGRMGDIETAGIYISYSADKIKWTEVPKRVFPYYPDGETSMMYDPSLGKYLVHCRQWIEREIGIPYSQAKTLPLRTVGVLIVDDALKPWVNGLPERPTYIWGTHKLPAPGIEFKVALACDKKDPPESDIYYQGVTRYPWADDVYLAFPTLYRHFLDEPGSTKKKNDGLTCVQLATSRDGIHWRRFRGAYIRLGVKGSPDSAMISYQRALVRDGDELCQYYFASYNSHAAHIKLKDKNFKGMTVQRLDGFVSADADYEGGEFTTPLIIFDGNKLELNIDTTATGHAQVEILDRNGLPVKGFSLKESDMIQGNFVRIIATWRNADVSTLRRQQIRLRFVMREAKLYAFQFSH